MWKENITNKLRYWDKIKVNGILWEVKKINGYCYFSTNDNTTKIKAMLNNSENKTWYNYNYIINSLFSQNNKVVFIEEWKWYLENSIYKKCEIIK